MVRGGNPLGHLKVRAKLLELSRLLKQLLLELLILMLQLLKLHFQFFMLLEVALRAERVDAVHSDLAKFVIILKNLVMHIIEELIQGADTLAQVLQVPIQRVMVVRLALESETRGRQLIHSDAELMHAVALEVVGLGDPVHLLQDVFEFEWVALLVQLVRLYSLQMLFDLLTQLVLNQLFDVVFSERLVILVDVGEQELLKAIYQHGHFHLDAIVRVRCGLGIFIDVLEVFHHVDGATRNFLLVARDGLVAERLIHLLERLVLLELRGHVLVSQWTGGVASVAQSSRVLVQVHLAVGMVQTSRRRLTSANICQLRRQMTHDRLFLSLEAGEIGQGALRVGALRHVSPTVGQSLVAHSCAICQVLCAHHGLLLAVHAMEARVLPLLTCMRNAIIVGFVASLAQRLA